jgi:2-amino-4-hydroxy-6-hydroxymethyldihydropteridine diphosphokinase
MSADLSGCAIIALGSNLGDSPRIILQAMDRLQAFSDQLLRRSSLWQTSPVDCPAGSPLFINAVVAAVPCARETPESLLEKLLALEKELGRLAAPVRHAPRVLDLDLIAFGNATRSAPDLILPHPRAFQRRFVLAPLSEIAPDLVLPGRSSTVTELLARLENSEIVRPMPPSE